MAVRLGMLDQALTPHLADEGFCFAYTWQASL